MAGGGAGENPPAPPYQPPQQPPHNDGEFLLRLLQNHQPPPPPHNPNSNHSPHNLSLDPAVAAMGPSIPTNFPTNRHQHQNYDPTPRPFSVSPQNPNFFLQGFPPPQQTSSFFSAPHQHFDLFRQRQEPLQTTSFGNFNFPNIANISRSDQEKLNLELEFELELLKERKLGLGVGSRTVNGLDPNPINWAHMSPQQRQAGPPPGFGGKSVNQRWSFGDLNNVGKEFSSSSSERSNNHSNFSSSSKDYEKERRFPSGMNSNGIGLSGQIEHPGLPTGSNLHSVSPLDFEESSHAGVVDYGVNQDELDDLSERLVDSVLGEDESEDNNVIAAKKKQPRDKDFRSDARGKWILSQRIRISRRLIDCRRDIGRLSAPFLAIYESLIPEEEEKAKQKQLLALLEKLVRKEWPNARLFLYGSCANSFGVSKSDIDVCLAINDQDVSKSEILLKLADILQSDNLQNVQALTRARVPIVKLMDPVTGISCDICINNVLAVVNSKLLRDYAEIDVRLRQLAFLVKHWAKSRGVNETYQGTLSSYAYVLMCIHFLQQRNPPVLPCLQAMEPTYTVTVDNTNCAFFDKVERLRDFGSRNKESIAQLVWGFFNYWAYCHDFANSVISVRTGSILSKHEKDWTRRIGNDRHLICIEDPFETSHDLGRVVDKNSIRVLREEFERAAEMMQYDPNPCASLFDRYIPS